MKYECGLWVTGGGVMKYKCNQLVVSRLVDSQCGNGWRVTGFGLILGLLIKVEAKRKPRFSVMLMR